MKTMKKLLFLTAITLFGCNQETLLDESIVNNEPTGTLHSSSSPRLVFDQLSDVEEYISLFTDPVASFRANSIAQTRSAMSLKQSGTTKFVSLLEEEQQKILSTLSEEQLKEINDENLVYIPEDSIIFDSRIASIVNSKREIQIGYNIYKYTIDGEYIVNEKNEHLLSKIDNNENIDQYISSGLIKFNSWEKEKESGEHLYTVKSQQHRPPLKIKNNSITIFPDKIRDIDFNSQNDKGLTNKIVDLGKKGKSVTAINEFRKGRKMLVTVRSQSILGISTQIGVEVKMQRRKFGIWFGTDAEELVIGWSAIEIKSVLDVPSATPNRPSQNQTFPPLTTDFPFQKNYTLLSVPASEYDTGIKYVNKLFERVQHAALNKAKRHFTSTNTPIPSKYGLFSISPDYTFYSLFPEQEKFATKKNKIENNFYSRWFSGTFIFTGKINGVFNSIGGPKVSIKEDKTSLHRAVVYGAAKYSGEWRAARITKTN